MFEETLPVIKDDSKGLTALVWIIGEFGHKLDYAPYLIETIIESYSEVDSFDLINSILLSSCKLFFKSPGEMQEILGKLFAFIINDFNDIDLKDRACYLYNLMKTNIEEAEFIICGQTSIDQFSDTNNINLPTLFNEFNTLSVLYQKPEEKFIKKYVNEEDLDKEKNVDISKEKNVEIQNENIQNNEVNEENLEPKYKYITYNKSSFDGKAILCKNEIDRLINIFSISQMKSFNNIPEEIDVAEFSEYLASECIFVSSKSQNGDIVELNLYSFDVRNLLNIRRQILHIF